MESENIPKRADSALTKSKRKHTIRRIVGYVIALACLVWVFHDIHLGRLLGQMSRLKWAWLVFAIISDTLAYISQGIRWRLLLRPIGDINTLKTTQAVYVGLFANEVLPFRVGEFIRGYLVSRWLSTEFISVIPSLAVERFVDGIWLAVGVAITIIFLQLPRNLMDAADILGLFVLLSTILFVYLIIRKERSSSPKSDKASPRWKLIRIFLTFIERIASGIKNIGKSRAFYVSMFVSSLVILFQITAFGMIFIGYGLHLSVWTSMAVALIVMLGTVIPNAPSNIGTFQFFCVVGLTLFGIDKTTATGASVVAFIILTLPLWAIGLVAISRSGMTLGYIRRELTSLVKGK
jgi:uncharacterized protein (TIRG00374 family)